MQVSVVLDSGERTLATLAVEFGYSLYTGPDLHLPVGCIVQLARPDARPLPEIPEQQEVVSATQILSTRIYRLRPVPD